MPSGPINCIEVVNSLATALSKQIEPSSLDWIQLIGSVATAIAAIGSLIALIFMYLQLRQVAAQIQSNTYQSIVNAEMDLWEKATATADIVNEAYAKELELSSEKTKSIMMGLSFYENIFYQHEQGTFPKKMWSHWQQAIMDVVCTTSYQKAWAVMRPYYYKPFADMVDKAIAATCSDIQLNNNDLIKQ